MKLKKILFLGLGAAGQRHLRIFKELLPNGIHYSAFRATKKTPLLYNDFSVNNESTIKQKYNLKLFQSLEDFVHLLIIQQ